MRWALVSLALAGLLSAACTDSRSSAVPTATTTSPAATVTATPITTIEVNGFRIQLGSCKRHRVTLNPISPVFEESPGAVSIPGEHTAHGINAAGNLARTIGSEMTVRDSARRLPGTWLAFAIRDEAGRYIAMRLAGERPGVGRPSQFELEGVRSEVAAPVTVEGPLERCADENNITHYRPVVVNIRGYTGILLSQEAGPQTQVPAINTLLWREGDMYWKLSGWDPPGRVYHTPALLLEIANIELRQWNPAAGSWLEVK